MTHMSAEDFPTKARPPHLPVPPRRKPTRFELWAWSPVISFQIGLTAGYAALVNFGITGLIASPPSLDLTTPGWYGGYWASALIVGAVLAAIGSIGRKKWWSRIETVGATLLTLTIGSYALIVQFVAYGLGDADKIAAGAGYTALAIPIIIRCMWLYSQLLRK